MVVDFVWLISLSIVPSTFIYVVINGKISLLLMANLYNIFHSTNVPHLYSFIINGHLDCFHILINNAVMNIGMHISFSICVLDFSGYIPRSGVLIFWGTSILFSIMAALIWNSTNSVQMFPFLHILTSTSLLIYWW